MQIFQIIVLIPLGLEFVLYQITKLDEETNDIYYVLSEMVIYILDGLQSLVLFVFIYKFKHVEIEIRM